MSLEDFQEYQQRIKRKCVEEYDAGTTDTHELARTVEEYALKIMGGPHSSASGIYKTVARYVMLRKSEERGNIIDWPEEW